MCCRRPGGGGSGVAFMRKHWPGYFCASARVAKARVVTGRRSAQADNNLCSRLQGGPVPMARFQGQSPVSVRLRDWQIRQLQEAEHIRLVLHTLHPEGHPEGWPLPAL